MQCSAWPGAVRMPGSATASKAGAPSKDACCCPPAAAGANAGSLGQGLKVIYKQPHVSRGRRSARKGARRSGEQRHSRHS